VLADLDGRIDAVVDGRATEVGVESTVLDVEAMSVYRPGAVTAAMIAGVVGGEVRVVCGVARVEAEGLASPGMGMRHYAPRARLVLVRGQAEMKTEVARHAAGEVGVMLPEGWDAGGAGVVFRWGAWGDAEVLARRLFAGLRELDDAGVRMIVCPVPEMGGLGEAMRDRLEKAARIA
jgi:L-threonylcarbamoyladenylate synthase